MANMYFGYKCINKTTGRAGKEMAIRSAACWAPLKFFNTDEMVTELTWSPNKGHSDHVKLLLPLLFPDIKYEEVQVRRTAGEQIHYAVRFTGLENVYRNNFMFRMFCIRNIDRDDGCTKSFDYMVKYGMNPLVALAVAANIGIRFGFNGSCELEKKGYARCMGNMVTVADVKAFARKPHKMVTSTDQLFSIGGGYGYKIGPNGRAAHLSDAAESAIRCYKATRPQFASKTWVTPTGAFLFALTKDKHFLQPDLANLMYKGL